MSVRSASKTIREARLKAGLTQEKLSEGICSALSLSRIENGSAGVSPSTFQALMTKAGAPCEVFPVFADRQDFDCYYTLKKARYYMDSWQLKNAYEELLKVKEMNWANNKFNYQEYLLLYCKILIRNNSTNHSYLADTLKKSLHISKKNIELHNLTHELLSMVEIEILICLAYEYLDLDQKEKCRSICTQIKEYLQKSQISHLEKNRLLAENAIAESRYYIQACDYETALEIAEANRHQMVLDADNPLLYELTFLTAIGYYYTQDMTKAMQQLRTVFYASYAIESCYATTCKSYFQKVLLLDIPQDILELPDISYITIPCITLSEQVALNNGVFELSHTTYYFGNLIHDIRTEKKLSQSIVCQGLCSKSKLSKIENNSLQPSVALAEALLQRLGMCERIFTFWGDERELRLHELKFNLIHSQRVNHKNRMNDLQQFKKLITEDDTLYYQFYLLEISMTKQNHYQKLQVLYEALSLTLPDFEIEHISDYCLSYLELSILNIISQEYLFTEQRYKSSIICDSLLKYMDNRSYDYFMQIYVFSITACLFSKALYNQQLYNSYEDIEKIINSSYLRYAIQFLGRFLFYYCQTLGNLNQKKEASFYGECACAINYLIEFDKNSEILIKSLKEDFNITIN